MNLVPKTFWLGLVSGILAFIGSLVFLQQVASAGNNLGGRETCPENPTGWSKPVCAFEFLDLSPFFPSPPGPIPPECPSPPPGYLRRDPGIASEALCRGACGVDCDPKTCFSSPAIAICVTNAAGDAHRNCGYTVTDCGSHPGCVAHDACYDICVSEFGETQLCPLLGICHCQCDQQCIDDYSIGDCNAWRIAEGYQPNRLYYTDPPLVGGVLPGPCP